MTLIARPIHLLQAHEHPPPHYKKQNKKTSGLPQSPRYSSNTDHHTHSYIVHLHVTESILRDCLCDINMSIYYKQQKTLTANYIYSWGDWTDFLLFGSSIYLKGILHPKMKILSFFTYPHVVPNP